MKVNFFIIGAPKCGTTALAYYLSQHPCICMANPKEPWFFSKDLEVGYPDLPATVEEYHNRYFRQFNSQFHCCVGEASPIYMTSSCAVDNILDYNPDAKFIAMVRNPVDIAYAMHANRFATSPCHENIADFEVAWRVQGDRLAGRNLPTNVIKPILLQYRQIASVGTQLKSVMEKVRPENLRVIVSDDMRSDTKKIYDDTLAFLCVAPFSGCDFSPANENKAWNNTKIRNFYYLLSRVKQRLPFQTNFGLLRSIRDKHVRVAKRVPLTPEFRQELRAEFIHEIELLSSLLGRDFSQWNSDLRF